MTDDGSELFTHPYLMSSGKGPIDFRTQARQIQRKPLGRGAVSGAKISRHSSFPRGSPAAFRTGRGRKTQVTQNDPRCLASSSLLFRSILSLIARLLQQSRTPPIEDLIIDSVSVRMPPRSFAHPQFNRAEDLMSAIPATSGDSREKLMRVAKYQRRGSFLRCWRTSPS